MTRAQLGALVQILALTALFTVALVAAGRVVDAPPEGGVRLSRAELCDPPAQCRPVGLPYRFSARPGDDLALARFRLTVPAGERVGPQAIYLPDYADALSLALDARALAVLRPGPPSTLNRNRPVLFTLPENAIGPEAADLEIVVAAHPQAGGRLGPVWVGPRRSLAEAYAWRHALTASLAQAVFLVLCGLSLAFVLLAGLRRSAATAWLAVATLAAAVYAAAFAVSTPPAPVHAWVLMSEAAIRLYAVAAALFLLRLVDVRAPRFERLYGCFAAACIAALALAPPHLTQTVSTATHILSIAPAVAFVVLFCPNRRNLEMVDTRALMAVFALMLASGIGGLFVDGASALGTVVTQLMPLLMLSLGGWAMMSQLVGAIRQAEALARTLQTRVDEKAAELEATYTELAERRRAEAVLAERERIMTDLHDGVGGQLVTALSYLEHGGGDRDLLRGALDACLADLNLTMDSLEADEDVLALLALLRARMTPVFEARGVKVAWSVAAPPAPPKPGPSTSLHILRIVQEALTNTLKHAEATRVRVRIDRDAIEIADDGRGFTPEARDGGVGLRSMARRAAALPAALRVEPGEKGTCLILAWTPPDGAAALP
ncbi:sensor histidine kinase [Rubrimonas cliftonensis]|uniref:histidine kinase n=1 Tax=Rubrimonas cliftonensis TaxID=89524 RepID=A0A1H4G7D3_9RHOB|nr:ATP-binding protein [Rubrimonas cliftonensis]SEB04818.1 Signal transduction histidine kinase [Rubrimonas cliftonensis]